MAMKVSILSFLIHVTLLGVTICMEKDCFKLDKKM